VSPQALHRLLRVALERVVLVLMTSLAVIVVAGVVFRKAGASLVWYDEVASIVLVWLTYYGACLAALDRAHIGVPNLARAAGPGLRRILGLLRRTVIIAFFLAVAWAGWRVLQVLEGTMLVGLPWVPARLTQSVIPIGALLFIVAELVSRPGGETPQADNTAR